MKPSRFEYEAPASLDECVALLAGARARRQAARGRPEPSAAHEPASCRAEPARRPEAHSRPRPDRRARRASDRRRARPAMRRSPHSELVMGRYPVLARAASLVGYPAIRARGTIGGSLAHADPAAELSLAALTLDAEIRLLGPGGSRSVDANEFFLGYFTTALDESELLVEVRFPIAPRPERWAFEEFSRKSGDFAVVAAAVWPGDGRRRRHTSAHRRGRRRRPAAASPGGGGDARGTRPRRRRPGARSPTPWLARPSRTEAVTSRSDVT